MTTTAKENLVKSPEKRVRRNPVEGKNKLKVKGEDPNYVYRIVNDVDDRVNDYLERGWEFETAEHIRIGDSRIDENSRLGKVRLISLGQGLKGVLMKIKRDFYNEDQEAKQDYINRIEQAMRPNPNDGGYGKIEITRK